MDRLKEEMEEKENLIKEAEDERDFALEENKNLNSLVSELKSEKTKLQNALTESTFQKEREIAKIMQENSKLKTGVNDQKQELVEMNSIIEELRKSNKIAVDKLVDDLFFIKKFKETI